MKASLKKAEIEETPPVLDQLRKAVASKDHGEIVRAFHQAIYGRSQKMGEALPVVKGFLTDADPFVRLTAARTLYTAGDRSGFETLSALVVAKEVIPDGKQDLRVEAARVLAKFRETEAATVIGELYSQTKTGGLLTALATLGQRASEASSWPFVNSDLAITNYGKSGASEFVAPLRATFASSTDPEIKNASAWTLARLTGEQAYLEFLTQAAQPAINANPKIGQLSFDDSSKALRYLGSLQSPVARAVLERALDSNNPVAVQYAVVNLLFNQPDGSEKAKQVVLREMRGEQHKLGAELMLNVASQLDDPEIRAAGEAFEQRSSDKSWQIYSVERRHWPIYNWIDGYVVALNR